MAVLAELQRYPALKGRLRIDIENARGELIGLRPREIYRAYGPDNPLEMCLNQAPSKGEEAHRIWNKGMFTKEPTLGHNRPATVEELIRNSFAFVQVYGRKAGTDQIATISQGLGWDRVSPMEDAAEEIISSIAGIDVRILQSGPYKFYALVRGNQDPNDVMQRFIDAPREPYRRWFDYLKDAQNEIQNMRQVDILGENGTGWDFIQAFNGEKRGMERAYKDNGKLSFQWIYERHGNELWGIELDNQPISMSTLALDSPDRETKEMLLAIRKFLLEDTSEDRWVIEFDFSETVSCCNISFNAQQSGLGGGYYDPSEIENLSSYQKLVTWPTLALMGELGKSCAKCGEAFKGGHECKKKQSKEAIAAEKIG